MMVGGGSGRPHCDPRAETAPATLPSQPKSV
jgi:hypothetical protein